MHRDQQWISRGAANVLALQSDGRRQYDIGVPGAGRPCRVVKYYGIRSREGVPQPVQILMVVEGVAASPVDQLYVGVSEPSAIIVERLSGMQQHVGNARHRDQV